MDVYILTWSARDTDNRFEIHGFGKTLNGESIVCRVVTKPYLFVKLAGLSLPRRRTFLDDAEKQYATVGHLCSLVTKKDAWGYSKSSDNFAKLVFNTQRDQKRAKKQLGYDKYEVYEGNVDPVVRLCHDRRIAPVGWIRIQSSVQGTLYYGADLEFVVLEHRVSPSTQTAIPPLVVCSWDIEVYSHNGNFPSSAHPENCIIQIASSFQRLGESKPYCTTVICLHETAEVEGVDIISVDDEAGVLIEWIELLRKHNVDIFLAYNSWQFDWEYIIGRQNVLQELMGDTEVAKHLRLMGRGGPEAGTARTWELNSGAYGQNNYSLIRAPGILDLDLMQLVKREHKLESYSLNNVSLKFLNDSKVDLPAYQIFEKFVQGPAERAEIATYAAQDVLLPLRLLTRLNIFENLTQMAIATGVPVEYLLSRGQQIKVFSVILKQAKDMGFLLPDDKNMTITGKFEGATVLDAKKGVYYDPVCGLDFASLYPSIMRTYNLCYSTLVIPGKDQPENVYTVDTGLGVYTFSQDEKGILPTLLENLATWRKDAKKKMALCKKQGDTFGESLWNGAQLAFKITMNSVYGFTGASRGFMPCVPIAAATTATGRRLIEETKQLCLEMVPGSDIVYGDTDSVMVRFKVPDEHTYDLAHHFEVAENVAARITAHFPGCIELEFEKAYYPYMVRIGGDSTSLFAFLTYIWGFLRSSSPKSVMQASCSQIPRNTTTSMSKGFKLSAAIMHQS
jgi:DNA polymerase delta subunit 1